MLMVLTLTCCASVKPRRTSATGVAMQFEPDKPILKALPDIPLPSVSQELPPFGRSDTLKLQGA